MSTPDRTARADVLFAEIAQRKAEADAQREADGAASRAEFAAMTPEQAQAVIAGAEAEEEAHYAGLTPEERYANWAENLPHSEPEAGSAGEQSRDAEFDAGWNAAHRDYCPCNEPDASRCPQLEAGQ
jgi:hypothetical protein